MHLEVGTVPSCFYIRDNVKIILLYVYYITFIGKTTILPLRTTFNYANYSLESRNFTKGEDILSAKHMQICVIVTEINVLRLFYICLFKKEILSAFPRSDTALKTKHTIQQIHIVRTQNKTVVSTTVEKVVACALVT